MTAMPHNSGYCKPDCFGCKVASVSFSSSAMPTRSGVAEQDRYIKTRHKDVAAYKRLRADGLQPKSTTGAAELESRASSKWEVETGMNLGGNEKIGRRFDEAQSAVAKGEVA